MDANLTNSEKNQIATQAGAVAAAFVRARMATPNGKDPFSTLSVHLSGHVEFGKLSRLCAKAALFCLGQKPSDDKIAAYHTGKYIRMLLDAGHVKDAVSIINSITISLDSALGFIFIKTDIHPFRAGSLVMEKDTTNEQLKNAIDTLLARQEAQSQLFPDAQTCPVLSVHLNDTQINDISYVARRLPHISKLVLSRSQVKDLSALASLQELTHLRLPQLEVADCSVLERLPKLTFLALRDQSLPVDLFRSDGPIAQIHTLDLRGAWIGDEKAPEFQILANLPQLQEIILLKSQENSAASSVAQLRRSRPDMKVRFSS